MNNTIKPTLEDKALAKAKEYVQWININNREPTMSRSSSTTEKRLASWYKMYKHKANKVRNYPVVDAFLRNNLGADVLVAFKSTKKDERDDHALERAKNYVQFLQTYGRSPRSKNAINSNEKSLHNWYYTIKRKNRKEYPKTMEYLDNNMKTTKNWSDTRSENALRKAMQYAAWVMEHYKKKPSTISKDLYEKKLAIWYNNYLRARKGYNCVDDYFRGMTYWNGKPLSPKEMNDAWYPNKPTVVCETNKAPYWENKLNLNLTPIVHKPKKENRKKPSGRPLRIVNKIPPPSVQNVQIFA